jgi:hypothetical protein
MRQPLDESRGLGIGDWGLVTGYWLLVTGYWLLVTGYWLLVTGYLLLGINIRPIASNASFMLAYGCKSGYSFNKHPPPIPLHFIRDTLLVTGNRY